MNIRHILNNVIVLLLPFVMGGVMLGYLNVISVLFILLVYLTTISRLDVSISFAIIFPPLFGWFFQHMNIGLPGSMFSILIGYLFLNKDIITIAKTPVWKRWVYIILILVIFVAYYLITGKTSNSTTKIIGLLVTVSYTPFFMLLAQNEKVNITNLAPVFFFYGLLMMLIGYNFLGYSKPTGLFDFITFRKEGAYNVSLAKMHMNYHVIGIAGLMGISFLLSVSKKVNDINIISIAFACVWLILASGARQALVGLVLLIALWMMLRSNRIRMSNIFISLIIIYTLYIFVSQLNIDFIKVMFDRSLSVEEIINRNYNYAYDLIDEYWLTGIGFGNYLNPTTGEIYPHNIVLELICEIGVIGIIILLIPIIIYISSNKVSWYDRFSNGALAAIIFLPYFIRSMISDDISRNIVVITLFVVIFSPKTRTFTKNTMKKILRKQHIDHLHPRIKTNRYL